jgi:hypothetical protein
VNLKSIAMTLLGLVLYVPVLAQEHAPLLATCEADLALWFNRDEFTEHLNAQTAFLIDKTPNKTGLNRLSVVEIIARHEEMGKCWSMTHRDIYHEADNSYMGIVHDREHDFIVRHNLVNQFRAEDAEGKR